MDNDVERNDPVSGYASVRHRMRYRLDNVLGRGTTAVLAWLGLLTLAFVVLSAVLLWLFSVDFSGASGNSWIEDFWQSLLRILDTGTMAGDVGWGRRILALAVTIFGVLVAGTLIGVIASGVEDRIDQMRRGRSVVIERDHVVVLGTSQRLPALIDQLVTASRRHPGRVIVVMADRDPTEMMSEVNDIVGDRLGTRIVYRSGDPTRRGDLELVRLHAARTVIVLAHDETHDTATVRTLFAIGAELGGFDRVPIVVELNDPTTAARVMRSCGAMVHPILPTQATARTAVFALLDSGLMHVVDELLDFRGCDLYVRDDADLVGLTFHEIVDRYEKARPIGRVRADGTPELNPPPGSVFESNDRLVVIADDDDDLDLVHVSESSPTAREVRSSIEPAPLDTDHLLVIGWNRFGAELIENWARLTAPSSSIEVILDPLVCDPATISLDGVGLEHASTTIDTNAVDRILRPDGRPTITTVLILPTDDGDSDHADAGVLLDLAELRTGIPASERPRCVVEFRDVTSSALIDLGNSNDYVISDAIGSRFIAQLSELPERRRVFLELYDTVGPSFRLESADRFGLIGAVTAEQVFRSAYDAGFTAFGWRAASEPDGGLVLNPHRQRRAELRPGDDIVVIG
ncbi:CASTOR/POLLUX-related putative ion channel [Ilumatobacter sp.]|uniref:CASTOR/POLLUX-related putative ion channel n=1 Tax=Ilumatobacter sp. TaxID=1967498 RepID=UPI003C4C7A0A